MRKTLIFSDLEMIAKEVLDYISLHPGVTREEIHETIIEKKRLLKDHMTFYPATWLNGLIDGLIEMKVLVVALSDDNEAISYGLAKFYLSTNISYLYGVAFGSTYQIVKLDCPECGKENLVNPLVHTGRQKKCRNCETILLESRHLPEVK